MRRAISQLRYYLQGGLTNEEYAQLSAEIQRDNRRNLLIFGIWLGTAHIPDKPAVTFIAVLLIAPLLFTLKPSRVIGFIAFIIAATTFEPEWVARTDTLNCCIYATISIMVSTYLTKLKLQRYLYESRVEYLSATDLLTGLRNGNAFERKTPVHADGCAHSLHCIYLDANGPHEINTRRATPRATRCSSSSARRCKRNSESRAPAVSAETSSSPSSPTKAQRTYSSILSTSKRGSRRKGTAAPSGTQACSALTST